MPTPVNARKIQWLAELQDVQGTPETLIAADGKARILEGLVPEPDMPKEERGIARATLTNLGSLASTEALTLAIGGEINTPDTITAAWEFADTAEACAQSVLAVPRIAIGAITGGPFVRNETVAGGTSTATGRVLMAAANGATHLYLQVLTGTFQSGEVLTGGTSGATATSSSLAVNAGWRIVPKSDDLEFITGKLEMDGFQWTLRDAMGNMSFEAEASMKGTLTFAMQGPLEDEGDQALTASVVQDTEEPPIFQSAGLQLDSFTPVVRSVSFDQQNNVVMRPDANASGTSGYIGSRVTGRDPVSVVNMEFPLAADYDLYTKFRSNTSIAVKYSIGTAEGKRFMAFYDDCQIESMPISNDEDIAMCEVTFKLRGTSDREYEFLLI